MTNSIAKALSRQAERPDIHYKVPKIKRGESYPSNVTDMVLDLKFHIPELSLSQLSTLVGIGCKAVRNILDNTTPEERWTEEDNPGSSAAELAALRAHHPGRQYEDERTYSLFDGSLADQDEWAVGPPILFTAPALRDPYRVADQSHTVKRPITLATRPFDVAA